MPKQITGKCTRCGGRVEYVDCRDPYWRHVSGAPGHPARPATAKGN